MPNEATETTKAAQQQETPSAKAAETQQPGTDAAQVKGTQQQGTASQEQPSSPSAKVTPTVTYPKKKPSKADKTIAKARKKMEKRAQKAANPKMPKLMRFFTIIFALSFVSMIMLLCFTSRDLVTYDPATLLSWLNVILMMVLLWMIWCRFKVARTYAVVVLVLSIVITGFQSMVGDVFDISLFIFSSAFDISMLLYFTFSKKARAYLTKPFGIDKASAIGEESKLKLDRRKWPFWRNLLIYYCFFSLAGHWMESGFCMLIRAGIVNGEVDLNNTMLWRDWFYPFPMEGLAVVIIAIALYPLFIWLRDKISIPGIAYALSFVINGLVCVTIEYVMGLFVNANLQLWDYSNMPFNLNGMICLQNGVGFAFAASIICWCIYPFLERVFARIPRNVMNLVFVVVLCSYSIPQALYLVDPPVSYREQLMEIINDPDIDDDTKAQARVDLEKLNELAAEGVTLAGAPDSNGSSSKASTGSSGSASASGSSSSSSADGSAAASNSNGSASGSSSGSSAESSKEEAKANLESATAELESAVEEEAVSKPEGSSE